MHELDGSGMSLNISETHPGLTAHNWQKWKRVFLTCPCHEIYENFMSVTTRRVLTRKCPQTLAGLFYRISMIFKTKSCTIIFCEDSPTAVSTVSIEDIWVYTYFLIHIWLHCVQLFKCQMNLIRPNFRDASFQEISWFQQILKEISWFQEILPCTKEKKSVFPGVFFEYFRTFWP